MAYRSFWPRKSVISQFASRGIDLVCIYPSNTLNSLGLPYSLYPPHWVHRGVYDWDVLDRQFDDIIEVNEQARFLCMVDLNTPGWQARFSWHDDSFSNLGKVAASEAWRKETNDYLHAFLEHTESLYGPRIEGYILACGTTCEWQDFSKGEESASRRAAWCRWSLDHGYGNPVRFPSAEERNQASHGLLRDPEKDAIAIRYWDFNRWLIADTILQFAGQAQATLKHRVPLGVFYGYVLEHGQNRLVSEGHLGFDKVYACSDLDFFVSPSPYPDREMGGASGFMLTVDSIKLHGKALIRELDHFTHTANGNPLKKWGIRWGEEWNHRWSDEASSLAGMKREFALTLISNVSCWWFDMWNHWYETEKILRLISEMEKIWEEQSRLPAKSVDEIAVLVDAESCLYLNQSDPQIDHVLRTLRYSLGRIGAPYSLYSLADIECIDFSHYKLIILPNLFAITEARRCQLQRCIMNHQRTLLWIHRAGVISEAGYAESNIEALTGLPYVPGKNAEKDFGAWKSVLHSDLQPSAEYLRAVAQNAGVHLYGEGGEPIYANSRLLASHSATGGRRKFTLRGHCKTVRELFSGRLVAENCNEFEDTLSAPGTVLYELNYEAGRI